MKQGIFSLVICLFLVSCTAAPDSETTVLTDTGEEVGVMETQGEIIADNEIVGEEIEVVPAIDLEAVVVNGNGTEPFWGFSASGSTLVLREASDSGPMDLTTYSGVIMENVGTSISITAPGMNLDLMLGTCSDGMSDIVYSYSTNFVAGSTTYRGCANIE